MKIHQAVNGNEDFKTSVLKFMDQNGYESDNTKRGVKTAARDCVAVFKCEPPDWIRRIWPSIAISILHLAVAKNERLPDDLDLPGAAIKR